MNAITERTKLIVGIDYGTTYSGLSFALSNATDFKDIFPWTKYPGSSSHGAEHCVKAPTRVAFMDENPELGENAWGYQVEPGMKTYAWTKLLLDKSSLLSEYDDPDLYLSSGMEVLQLSKGRSAKGVATEYLKGMKAMFDDAVKEHLGAHKIENLPIDFWLTVPASWSEKAKLLTKSAATDAGFATRPIDNIMLISEPEAAAQLALKSSLHRLEDFVKPKTGVMVCDCGGGTVDITTYEVEETYPTLKLREIAIGVVQNQVNQVKFKNEQPIETVVLVGGFGSSPYLKERLTKWCQIRGIGLTTPITGAWSAVVCGAVLRGLEGSIGDLVDKKTEINSEIFLYITGNIPLSETHTLYSCNLDDTPGTIENERVEEAPVNDEYPF
ncbi:hypothetical protein V8C42DRAFT_340281 [Trichoderma barbatum]